MCVGLVVISRGLLTRDWRSRARALDTFHVAGQLGDARLDAGDTRLDSCLILLVAACGFGTVIHLLSSPLVSDSGSVLGTAGRLWSSLRRWFCCAARSAAFLRICAHRSMAGAGPSC